MQTIKTNLSPSRTSLLTFLEACAYLEGVSESQQQDTGAGFITTGIKAGSEFIMATLNLRGEHLLIEFTSKAKQ